jgi:tRNA(Ile)-lysidine synthase
MRHQSTAIEDAPAARRVARTIDRHGMLAAGDRVLVAVSGGADSTALLCILHALAPEIGIKLAVAHLNHGLRGRAADGDARFVERMAGRLKLEFHWHRIQLDPSAGSLEDRGRRARYAFFNRLAEQHGYTKIALGHHMDDNAEAVLLHLLRGSGIRGLSGIPPVRGQRIVRPLMDLHRAEIIGFLQEHQIAYVEDASNADMRFDRNRVRQHLIPFLQKQFNSNVVAVLHRTADLCWHEERWLQTLLAPILSETIASLDPECMLLHAQRLIAEPLAVRRRLFRDALHKWRGNLKGIKAGHIDKLIELLDPPSEGKRICLPSRIGVERTRSHLRFKIRKGRGWLPLSRTPDFLYQVPLPESDSIMVNIAESGLRFKFSVALNMTEKHMSGPDANSAWFDMDKLAFPLNIRNFKPGDRMSLWGMQGHQKIKKIFGDRKIPLAQRYCTPLLVSGNEIIWVPGIRRSALATLTGQTARVLEVQILDKPCEIP